jgi:hypothetical protein
MLHSRRAERQLFMDAFEVGATMVDGYPSMPSMAGMLPRPGSVCCRKCVAVCVMDTFIYDIAMLPRWCVLLYVRVQVITWQQLGFHQKPIGLLNTEGFFDPLLKAFDSFIAEVKV